ncbi:MAG: hypothetical protein D4R68_03645 [Ignavibacteriales bacterium]|nr:MAG: hypothetical protein D4R68_03645 [Ignavibacteriales bacterium]
MKKHFLIILLSLAFSCQLFSQGTGGTNAKFEYRRLIDLPTAGILEKGFAGVTLDVMPVGVVITRIEVGVVDGFSFGISYGGQNIIGSGDIDWNKWPGVNIRARIVDETQLFPALAIGFDSQGKGAYDRDLSRYQIKSPGFFVAASKNFELFGYLSIHSVINYSMERDDGDKDLNLGVGFEKTIGSKVSFIGEYDFAVNDNTGNSLGKGNGYLNFGLRWSVGDGLTLGLDLRDFLNNKRIDGNKADRGIFVEYVKSIF